MDTESDFFAEQPYEKVALRTLAPVPANLHLFSAEWLGKKPRHWDTMKVHGCEFRLAKCGRNKGKLSVEFPGKRRTVYVHRCEIQAEETQASAAPSAD